MLPLVVASALVIALTGCAGGSSPQTAAISDGLFDLATDPTVAIAEEAAIGAAVNELARRCMLKRGWEEPDSSSDRASANWRPPVDSVERRRREGYGLHAAARARAGGSDTTDVQGVRSPSDTWLAKLPARSRERYDIDRFGPEGSEREVTVPGAGTSTMAAVGCYPDAQRAVYGSLEAVARIVNISPLVGGEIKARSEADPRHAALFARWSACMTAAGHPAITPDDARRELSEAIDRQGATPELFQREVATAVADLTCAQEVGLVAGLDAIHRDVARTLDAETVRAAMVAYEERAAALERAKRILTDGSPTTPGRP